MKTLKFLHCADIHLDMPFTSLGSTVDISSIRRQELKDTFARLVRTAEREQVDLLLICGDLYEHNYVRKSTLSFINELFASLEGIKVCIIPGNHDPFVANSYYRSFLWHRNVYILSRENPYVIFDDLDTCVYGIGFHNFYEEKSLLDDFVPENRQLFNILAVHGTVDISVQQGNYNPVSSSNLSSFGMDYVALGHFHNRIDCVGGYKNIYNPGSPEPLGFDEPGEHGALVGTIVKDEFTEGELAVQFIRMNTRTYERLDISIEGCTTEEKIAEKILHTVEGKNLCVDLFYITLKGYVESGMDINSERIYSLLKDRFFFLKLKDETLPDYNFDVIAKEPGLRGLFTQKVMNLIGRAEDAHDKELLLKALYYGLEALDKGVVEIS